MILIKLQNLLITFGVHIKLMNGGKVKNSNAVNKFNAFYARNNKNLVQDLSTILRKVK